MSDVLSRTEKEYKIKELQQDCNNFNIGHFRLQIVTGPHIITTMRWYMIQITKNLHIIWVVAFPTALRRCSGDRRESTALAGKSAAWADTVPYYTHTRIYIWRFAGDVQTIYNVYTLIHTHSTHSLIYIVCIYARTTKFICTHAGIQAAVSNERYCKYVVANIIYIYIAFI